MVRLEKVFIILRKTIMAVGFAMAVFTSTSFAATPQEIVTDIFVQSQFGIHNDNEKISKVVAPYKGRILSEEAIKELSEKISALYRGNGYKTVHTNYEIGHGYVKFFVK